MDREPAVAGRFYRGDPGALALEVKTLLGAPDGRAAAGKVRAVGVVAPHAGYVYSGAIAGAVYGRLELPGRAIVLGPNHTGLGSPAALWPAGGGWRTPLGTVPVSAALTGALAAHPLVALDRAAHLREHSLEVQLPFLQAARPDLELAALCLAHLPVAACRELGRAVAAAARDHGALLIASSDMSHYIPAAEAREKDRLAIDRILALDPEGLHRTVEREAITMCGVIPTTVMLFAARELGATRAELVRYGSSGDVTGDDREVVGYAGLIIT
jgi:AmmeMemoRadiSam system protein B